ncbi:MAG: fibronectin type III domain-containing protein [Vicinamibacterales bacterium]
MKKYVSIIVGVIAGNVLAAAILWMSPSGSAIAPPPAAGPAAAPATEATGAVQFAPQVVTGDELGGSPAGLVAPQVLPTPIPNETQVFFVPTDNDATATVLYLYNTDSVAHIVALRGFSYNGVLVYSLNINVGATSFLRLASDSISAAPPPSWATPAPIITNFTDFTYYAMLSLPQGVRVEGYTLYNPGTGVVDPRADQGAVPLVFTSTPPATTTTPQPPGPPLNFLATLSAGNTVTFSWSAPTTGGAPTGYILEAGSAPGLANLATLPLPTTSYTVAGVPRGTYFLRVRAVNAIGPGPASNEVQLNVP